MTFRGECSFPLLHLHVAYIDHGERRVAQREEEEITSQALFCACAHRDQIVHYCRMHGHREVLEHSYLSLPKSFDLHTTIYLCESLIPMNVCTGMHEYTLPTRFLVVHSRLHGVDNGS